MEALQSLYTTKHLTPKFFLQNSLRCLLFVLTHVLCLRLQGMSHLLLNAFPLSLSLPWDISYLSEKKGKPFVLVLQGALRLLKAGSHSVLRMRSSPLRPAPGAWTRNTGCYLQDHQAVWRWGRGWWGKGKLNWHRALLLNIHCLFWLSIYLVIVNCCLFSRFLTMFVLKVSARFFVCLFCSCVSVEKLPLDFAIPLFSQPSPTKIFMAHLNMTFLLHGFLCFRNP